MVEVIFGVSSIGIWDGQGEFSVRFRGSTFNVQRLDIQGVRVQGSTGVSFFIDRESIRGG